MKKLLLLFLPCFLLSCDFMMKDRSDDKVEATTNKVVLGTDKDENGCVTSAGYKWCILRKECIRPFEEGYRLNSITQLEGESIDKSAFVIFEEDGDRAELFLPDEQKSVILDKEGQNGGYGGSGWKLHQQDGYKLQKGAQVLYAGAKIEEGQITGSDKPEESAP
ncbi:hypothetical protein [uncultured Flavobacterium sp.]|uniref:hypothetical protein n=1 Tax=uncultured Flavobacterium sp. TaxID=165435 RepID=UPI0025DD6197|nr:hypothetical protein [uncultured Flavobacterium sp.]